MSFVLLNPGPVNISDRVRSALSQMDICHREEEFSKLLFEIRQRLLNIYTLSDDKFSSVVISGSGTAALEMMLISLIPPKGKALVIINGIYGERAADILDTYNIDHSKYTLRWGETIKVSEIESIIKKDSEITHLFLVHHETTTGKLNSLKEVGELCRRHSISLLLDAVSSFGGEELDFNTWSIDACAGSSNKCLHGVPGVSFIIFNRGKIQ
ncbi:MAG: aminotransferase class V-fold PLP-dependent enzyme, partial [Bacteroidetes bacterium]|nr:aminotransferase class V-fold PLP-dependent enzyme [Bacteroidota bacterium]